MRDVRILELISAFLDGELTVEERVLVERELATSAEYRAYLDQLKRQRMALQGVPRRKLSADVSARIQAAIRSTRPASASAQPVSVDDSISELISAHLDGELTDAERGIVERHLADSVECREYLEQLRQQQSLLASIPRHKLPSAVSERILAAIEVARSLVAKEEPILATLATPAKSRSRSRWRTALYVAGPMVAAGLLVALFVARNWDSKGTSGPGQTIAGNDGKKVEETTPGIPEVVPVRPEDMALALEEFQKVVSQIVVYDIYVTPTGHENNVVAKWLAAAAIPVANKIKLDNNTENAIFNSPRMGIDRVDLKLPGKVDQENVEMMFVRGTNRHINAVYEAYRQNDCLIKGEAQIVIDYVMAPRELEILFRLNEASGVGLAHMKSNPSILKSARAFPINFASQSRTSFFGGFGLTSMLVGNADDLKTIKSTKDFNGGWDEPTQCIFIIRTIK